MRNEMARTHRRITGKLARPFPAKILFRDFEELRSNPAPLMSRLHPKLVKEPQPRSLLGLGRLAQRGPQTKRDRAQNHLLFFFRDPGNILAHSRPRYLLSCLPLANLHDHTLRVNRAGSPLKQQAWPFDAILPESAVASRYLWSRLFLALPLSAATCERGLSFSLWRPPYPV